MHVCTASATPVMSCTCHVAHINKRSSARYIRFSQAWNIVPRLYPASLLQEEIKGSGAARRSVFRFNVPNAEEQGEGRGLGATGSRACSTLLNQTSWPAAYFEEIPRTLQSLPGKKSGFTAPQGDRAARERRPPACCQAPPARSVPPPDHEGWGFPEEARQLPASLRPPKTPLQRALPSRSFYLNNATTCLYGREKERAPARPSASQDGGGAGPQSMLGVVVRPGRARSFAPRGRGGRLSQSGDIWGGFPAFSLPAQRFGEKRVLGWPGKRGAPGSRRCPGPCGEGAGSRGSGQAVGPRRGRGPLPGPWALGGGGQREPWCAVGKSPVSLWVAARRTGWSLPALCGAFAAAMYVTFILPPCLLLLGTRLCR